MSLHPPELSVVIPAYNEEARLGPTLSRIIQYLESATPAYEILVVDDGSSDRTVQVAEEAARDCSKLRVLQLGRNRGKGAAVRKGMLDARGAQVLFSDADLATPIEELQKLQKELSNGAAIAIGSRALAGSDIRVRQHPVRELMGRTFNVLVRLLTFPGIKDTQCGFKLFTREAARDLFARQSIDGFAFDVEILWLARDRYEIAQIPVVWRHVEESKVSLVRASSKMLLDLMALRVRRIFTRGR
ncbi:MAG: dolichyl-phosphate beta-glucosyltransferase [Planctomycetota bacterium]